MKYLRLGIQDASIYGCRNKYSGNIKRKRYFGGILHAVTSDERYSLSSEDIIQKKNVCPVINFIINFAYRFLFTSIYVEEAS